VYQHNHFYCRYLEHRIRRKKTTVVHPDYQIDTRRMRINFWDSYYKEPQFIFKQACTQFSDHPHAPMNSAVLFHLKSLEDSETLQQPGLFSACSWNGDRGTVAATPESSRCEKGIFNTSKSKSVKLFDDSIFVLILTKNDSPYERISADRNDSHFRVKCTQKNKY
jgi:hypothetical protein